MFFTHVFKEELKAFEYNNDKNKKEELFSNKCPYCNENSRCIIQRPMDDNIKAYKIKCKNCEKDLGSIPIYLFEKCLNKKVINLECGAKIEVIENYKNYDNEYIITIFDVDGKKIYNTNWYKKEWDSCEGFIEKKLEILLSDNYCLTLSKPYVMLSVYGRMYKMSDLDYTKNFRSLRRNMTPIGYYTEESELHDLITLGWMYSISTYEKDELVFIYDEFYINGKKVATYDEIKEKFNVTRVDLDFGEKSDQIAKYIYEKTGEKAIKYEFGLLANASGDINF